MQQKSKIGHRCFRTGQVEARMRGKSKKAQARYQTMCLREHAAEK